MNNKNKLINSKQLQSKIFKLGQFVKRYVNGIFDEEYDLVNPCAFDYVIHSTLFPLEGEYKQVVIKEDTIVIIMNNGDIVDVKVNQKVYHLTTN